MKSNKKLRIGKLNFYIIDDNYIEYLSRFDKHIAYNKNKKRPYIGVILVVENHYYFAPLFSPKQKHNTQVFRAAYKSKMINEKTKNDLGIIRFSDMIPVPQESVYLLDIKNKSYGYKRLLSEQYSYINKPDNKQKIIDKAEKIYNIVTKDKKSKVSKFYKDLSCNFKLLEEKCIKYQN